MASSRAAISAGWFSSLASTLAGQPRREPYNKTQHLKKVNGSIQTNNIGSIVHLVTGMFPPVSI